MAMLTSKDYTAAKNATSEAQPDDHWIKRLILILLSLMINVQESSALLSVLT